jgi:hypothetical protein
MTAAVESRADTVAAQVATYVQTRPVLAAPQANALIDRIRARQTAVGYESYAAWMEAVTPPDAD